ncbi:MAG: hypothetical protein Q8912_13475 [Bacillota bacterium]|nr:hypothetical protein [Bacillota bacterium]
MYGMPWGGFIGYTGWGFHHHPFYGWRRHFGWGHRGWGHRHW